MMLENTNIRHYNYLFHPQRLTACMILILTTIRLAQQAGRTFQTRELDKNLLLISIIYK
jgi:hypothetical protein